MKLAILSLAIAAVVAGCTTNPDKSEDPGPVPGATVSDTAAAGTADELYAKAKRELERGQYEVAVSEFENLEATFPFGEHAAQARLDIAYAYFKQSEFDNSTAALDRFLKLYPQSEHSDYAFYLKGLVNFSRGKSIVERLVPRKLYRLDQSALRTSFSDFATLVRKYPESIYAEDSRQRMVFLRNEMARHELATAEHYFERSAMVAVINRVNTMLDQYTDSPYTADGLALLAKAHIALGNTQIAQDTIKILELNHPEHPEIRKLGDLQNQSG